MTEPALIDGQSLSVPMDWDYDVSVGRVKPMVYKWKNMTGEVLRELWIAREVLSQKRCKNNISKSWSDYCREKWELGRNYVNKLIASASTASNLGTNVPIPTNEGQVRPLTRLGKPEQQRQAWEKGIYRDPR